MPALVRFPGMLRLDVPDSLLLARARDARRCRRRCRYSVKSVQPSSPSRMANSWASSLLAAPSRRALGYLGNWRVDWRLCSGAGMGGVARPWCPRRRPPRREEAFRACSCGPPYRRNNAPKWMGFVFSGNGVSRRAPDRGRAIGSPSPASGTRRHVGNPPTCTRQLRHARFRRSRRSPVMSGTWISPGGHHVAYGKRVGCLRRTGSSLPMPGTLGDLGLA